MNTAEVERSFQYRGFRINHTVKEIQPGVFQGSGQVTAESASAQAVHPHFVSARAVNRGQSPAEVRKAFYMEAAAEIASWLQTSSESDWPISIMVKTHDGDFSVAIADKVLDQVFSADGTLAGRANAVAENWMAIERVALERQTQDPDMPVRLELVDFGR